MRLKATLEQSETFTNKIIGKTLEQAIFMTHPLPYDLSVYDAKACFAKDYDVSRIIAIIENGIIVKCHIG
jgi:hypothetical protein